MYKCKEMQPLKMEKEGKPHGKNPPPKRGKYKHAEKKHEGRHQQEPPRTTSVTLSIDHN